MVQLRSDLARQSELMHASLSAKREGAVFYKSPLYERLAEMQEKSNKRKARRFPWITVISVVSIIPFMVGGSEDKSANSAFNTINQIQQGQNVFAHTTPEHEINNLLAVEGLNEKATVSVTIGGKTVSKELSVSDIQRMQGL